jgi:hypothetical protein
VTWTCTTCGPVPAGAIRHLDHDSPHGHEQHECGSSAGLDWTTKEHEMTTTEPNADWFDLCLDAELGKPHEPHAYSTAEPSGCPGHVGAATRPACNCFMRGGKHSFKCHLARFGRPPYDPSTAS